MTMNPATGGLREAIGHALEWARRPKDTKQFVRTPAPDASWIPIKLAATWIAGKIPQGTTIDGNDGRLQQAAAILLDWARQGRVEMLTLDEDQTHYFRRAQIEALVLDNAVKIELSTDPSGSYINRGADGEFPKKRGPIVLDRSPIPRTEQASAPLPMPSPFGPRGGKVPEASSGPYDPGWQS